MTHRQPAHVPFVDHGVVPRDPGRPVIAPGEGGVDDAAFRGAGRAVAPVEGQIRSRASGPITEVRIAPDQGTVQGLGIRLDQELVGIEAMSAPRIIRAVDPVTVQKAGTCFRQIGVPVSIGALANLDALDFMSAGRIEYAQLDLLAILRKQRKIHTFTVPGRAARIGLARPHSADETAVGIPGSLWG